jgi:2Fe-2S ferredoxin
MITIHLLTPTKNGSLQETVIQTKVGISLMEAATQNGVKGIAADCGGLLTCATCHVMVRGSWADRIPQATEDEKSMLEFTAAQRKESSRLSCQIQITEDLDGFTVELPETQY